MKSMFIGVVLVMHSSFVTKNLFTAIMPSVVNTRRLSLENNIPSHNSAVKIERKP